MQASFLVWRQGDRYLLLAADLQEASQKRLQMFVLRAKVKLAALTDSSIMLGLSGPQAEEVLADRDCPARPALWLRSVWVIRPSSIWMARVM
jgi:folate-binding Fe-S cluster repair protein YgfZ